jgi:cysteinyl-tRNA synthetase
MYVCGPTVYENAHLGHMRAALVFDVLRRYLEYRGYQVTHVQNVTDIEDKIINKAREEGISTEEVTRRYSAEYHDAVRALNILPWDVEPHATAHIPEMVEMIRTLLERGSAYYAEGDVYFDVTTLADYGKLSGQKPDELKAGARVEPGEFKRHPADFALWKKAKPGEPSWDSPWGPGRPGWHIECSAMSLKYLGMGFDIHGGGDDLIFPHHENEIAQAEAYAGAQPFVRYWLHNAMVMTRGEKMSKSLRNYFTVSEALRRYRAEIVRYALIAVHYRKPLDFELERFEDAQKAVARIRDALASANAVLHRAEQFGDQSDRAPSEAAEMLHDAAVRTRDAFLQAMDDDLNTAGALGVIFELAADLNRVTDAVLKGTESASAVVSAVAQARRLLSELLAVMGLRIAPFTGGVVFTDAPRGMLSVQTGETDTLNPGQSRRLSALLADLRAEAAHLFPQGAPDDPTQLVPLILEGREHARKMRDFKTADTIRSRLSEAGILVEDLPTGPRWLAPPDGHAGD